MRPTDKHYCQRTDPRIIQPKIKLHKKVQTACVIQRGNQTLQPKWQERKGQTI